VGQNPVLFSPIDDFLLHSDDSRDQVVKLSEIAPEFCCFGPKYFFFWGGRAAEISGPILQIWVTTEHTKIFSDDRPNDLQDCTAKKESLKKETTTAIYKAGSASYPDERPNNLFCP